MPDDRPNDPRPDDPDRRDPDRRDTNGDPDDVVREVIVDAPAERAFAAFTEGIAAWWPTAFTFSGGTLDTIVVDGRGGRWYERDLEGTETDWGGIRVWHPPHRAVLAWRIAADRSQEPHERASSVEVRFDELGTTDEEAAAGAGVRTRVTVRHGGFERHRGGAEAMRAGMASPQGWTALLDAYRRTLDDGRSPAARPPRGGG